MKAYWKLTQTHLKVGLREWEVLFWNFILPLGFFFLFTFIFGHGTTRGVTILLPGVLCSNAMSAAFYGLSVNLVYARESGTLRLFQVSGIHPGWLLASEFTFGILMLAGMMVLQVILAIVLFQVSIQGSLLAFTGLCLLSNAVFLSLSLFIAGIARTTRIAPVLASLFFFPFMFLGGATLPRQLLPESAKMVSTFFPSTYVVTGLHNIIETGGGLRDNAGVFGILLVFLAVSLGIAIKSFRWE